MDIKIIIIGLLGLGTASAVTEQKWQKAYPLLKSRSEAKNKNFSSLHMLKLHAQAGDVLSKQCLEEWRKLYMIPHYQITEECIRTQLYNLYLIEKNGKLPAQIHKVVFPSQNLQA